MDLEKGKLLAKLLNYVKDYAREKGVAPIEIERAGNAILASYIVRSLPMTCDKDIVISAFYEINVSPIVFDCISQLNEIVVVDSNALTSLIRSLWEERFMVASGRYSGKIAKTLFKSNRISEMWREAACGNDAIEDLLERLNDNPIGTLMAIGIANGGGYNGATTPVGDGQAMVQAKVAGN